MVGDRNKLRKLRSGTPPAKRIILGSGDASIEIKVIALTADIIQQVEECTEEYYQKNKDKVNAVVRQQVFNKYLVLNCMRDVDDINVHVADSFEEVSQNMELEDINRVCNAYAELMMNKAPKMELITGEQLTEIKNFLEVTQLSDISTVLQINLKSFHQTMLSER